MKVIFNYTIPHTGTHFVMDLLRQGYSPTKWCPVDDMWYGNRYKNGYHYEDNFSIKWLNKNILYNQIKFIEIKAPYKNKPHKIQKEEIDLLLIKGHHWHRNKPLDKILKGNIFESSVKFISPIRDPFLAILTRAWQGWHRDGRNLTLRPEQQRLAEARRICQTFVDILILKSERMFIFSIDNKLSKTEEYRISLYKDLYKFCGLKETTEALKYIKVWNPVNTSQDKSRGAKVEDNYKNIFNKIKIDYLKRDIKSIENNKYCNVEFNFLKKEKHLIDLLKNKGYSNLLWW